MDGSNQKKLKAMAISSQTIGQIIGVAHRCSDQHPTPDAFITALKAGGEKEINAAMAAVVIVVSIAGQLSHALLEEDPESCNTMVKGLFNEEEKDKHG